MDNALNSQFTMINPQFTKQFSKFFKEIFAPLMFILAVISLVLSLQLPVFAQSPGGILEVIGEKTKLPSYQTAGHAGASYQQGASNITSAILFAIDFLKYVMGSVAIFFIIYSGIRLLTAAKQVEDVATKQKEHLKYAIIGLIVIMVADQFVRKVFFGEQGEVYASKTTLQEAAKTGTELIRGIYNVFEYFAASLAVLMIVISGFRYVSSGGNEEVQKKAKKNITWAIIGLMLIGIAEFAVKDIIFPKQGTTLSNVENAKKLIVNLTNFVSGFVATLSVIMYIYGGYLYVTAFGKEDNTGKAKKVFIGATIGLLLSLGAFALVSTTVNLQSEIPK